MGLKTTQRSVTQWTAFTPTGSWVSNVTYTGFKRQVGENYEYEVMVAITGTPTTASLTITIPDTIDTTKITNSVSTIPKLGWGIIRDTGTAVFAASVNYNSTTAVSVIVDTVSGSFISLGSPVTQASPMTFANTDQIVLRFSAPIVGLGA